MYEVNIDFASESYTKHEKENLDQVIHMLARVIKLKIKADLRAEIHVMDLNNQCVIYVEV